MIFPWTDNGNMDKKNIWAFAQIKWSENFPVCTFRVKVETSSTFSCFLAENIWKKWIEPIKIQFA